MENNRKTKNWDKIPQNYTKTPVGRTPSDTNTRDT